MSKCVLVDCTSVTNSLTPGPRLFMNDRVLVGCADGSLLAQCSAPANYPAGITFDTGAGKVAVAAGTFGASTLANANALALIYGTDFIAGEVTAGRMKCGSFCLSIIVLKDQEATSVLNAFCENLQLLNGKIFFMPYDGGVGNKFFISSDGLNWSVALSATAQQKDITYGAGLYVTTGNISAGHEVVYTSPDAVTWTLHTTLALGTSTVCICFGAGVFIIGDVVGRFYHSVDGINWTNGGRINPALGQDVRRIRFINNTFWAISFFGNWLFKSTTGLVWSSVGTFTGPTDIAYGNGIYALSTNGNVYTSPDGITWTAHPTPGGIISNNLTFGDGLFVLGVGNALTPAIYYSTDCINWTLWNFTPNLAPFAGVYIGNGKFIVAEG